MLLQTGGALLFIVAALGWYMTFVIMAAEMVRPTLRRTGIPCWLLMFWARSGCP